MAARKELELKVSPHAGNVELFHRIYQLVAGPEAGRSTFRELKQIAETEGLDPRVSSHWDRMVFIHTPASLCAFNGNFAAVELLLRHGACRDMTVKGAAAGKQLELVGWLIAEGADPNFAREGWAMLVDNGAVGEFLKSQPVNERTVSHVAKGAAISRNMAFLEDLMRSGDEFFHHSRELEPDLFTYQPLGAYAEAEKNYFTGKIVCPISYRQVHAARVLLGAAEGFVLRQDKEAWDCLRFSKIARENNVDVSNESREWPLHNFSYGLLYRQAYGLGALGDWDAIVAFLDQHVEPGFKGMGPADGSNTFASWSGVGLWAAFGLAEAGHVDLIKRTLLHADERIRWTLAEGAMRAGHINALQVIDEFDPQILRFQLNSDRRWNLRHPWFSPGSEAHVLKFLLPKITYCRIGSTPASELCPAREKPYVGDYRQGFFNLRMLLQEEEKRLNEKNVTYGLMFRSGLEGNASRWYAHHPDTIWQVLTLLNQVTPSGVMCRLITEYYFPLDEAEFEAALSVDVASRARKLCPGFFGGMNSEMKQVSERCVATRKPAVLVKVCQDASKLSCVRKSKEAATFFHDAARWAMMRRDESMVDLRGKDPIKFY